MKSTGLECNYVFASPEDIVDPAYSPRQHSISRLLLKGRLTKKHPKLFNPFSLMHHWARIAKEFDALGGFLL